MIPLSVAITRLGLSLLFGALLGIEREWRHKNAGIKTNTLVAIGATTFAMLSNTFGANNHNPAQIAAAVVTGIGFIGAGVIIHRGATVQGVTTAATLWANASMGVAMGLGQMSVGIAMFVAIIAVQFTMRQIGVWILRVRSRSTRIDLHVDAETVEPVNEAWSRFERDVGVFVVRRSVASKNNRWRWSVSFISTKPLDITKFEERLVATKGVHHVEARFGGFQEDPDQVM